MTTAKMIGGKNAKEPSFNQHQQHHMKSNNNSTMTNFLLWLLLFLLAWPIAILALIAYPIIWLLLLPFRFIGIVFEGLFELFRNVVLLPARVVGYRRRERVCYDY